MTSRPLDGIRVTDFSWIGAGSFTTRVLADHGADVIKIESMERPDHTRLTPPFKDGVAGVNRSGYFADRNTSKRSLALNLKTEQGREIALSLYEHSDVVANNFRPGTLSRLGLGYDEAVRRRPDIVFLEMSMQGATGPWHDHLGYGLTISALTGLHDLSGHPDREPVGTGTNYPDHVPSPGHAVVAVLAALLHRDRTGEGQYIDVAQSEATVSVLGVPLLEFLETGRVPTRHGNAAADMLWQGVLPCAGDDRWIAVSVPEPDHWRAFVDVLGVEEPIPDADSHALPVAISEATRTSEPWALMAALQARGVPAGVVQHAGDLVDHDPQLAHRRHFVRLPHEEMGETTYSSLPFRFSATPSPIDRAAPRLGEHTREVLGEVLGLSTNECEQLASDGVLA